MTGRILTMVLMICASAQMAQARNICFAENSCDFRGFACVSEGDRCTARRSGLQAKVNSLQEGQSKLRRQLAATRAALSKAQAVPVVVNDEETNWKRDKAGIVAGYAGFMLCVRDATTLEMAQDCANK